MFSPSSTTNLATPASFLPSPYLFDLMNCRDSSTGSSDSADADAEPAVKLHLYESSMNSGPHMS